MEAGLQYFADNNLADKVRRGSGSACRSSSGSEHSRSEAMAAWHDAMYHQRWS